jgi:tol-pal system protein YbgF
MTHRATFLIAGALALMAAAPALAQNRVEQQLFLELRTLQSQVQQLTAAINAVNERITKTDAKLDAQASATTKGFADQKVLIDSMSGTQRSMSELQNEGSVRLLQLNQEMKAIREGLGMQQSLLNQILAQLPQPGAATQPVDPNAPTTPLTPPSTIKPGGIPPSPGEYYSKAFDYFYKGMFAEAIEFLSDAIKRFPDSPEAARAQFVIGDANLAMGGKDAEALAAYAAVIKNYKDPEVLPDAYLKQGDAYERLGQKENARKSYEEVRAKFPNSSSAIFATAALKRMGIIK